ncbi:MAG: helix-turn-helix transcriptional regulator [Mycolicibacterium neoaurum]|uniref:helix-turn-helix domain-containing protein n=1 Tax=Mycolicibacterium neoaurum TaxID=1795 RepID=UPI002FF4A698
MPNGTATNRQRYANQRTKVPAPMVPLAILRKSQGITLQAVCDHINAEFSFKRPVERGTISAIENGHRGASAQMLAAIASALNIPNGSIDTQYEPRQRAEGQVPA